MSPESKKLVKCWADGSNLLPSQNKACSAQNRPFSYRRQYCHNTKADVIVRVLRMIPIDVRRTTVVRITNNQTVGATGLTGALSLLFPEARNTYFIIPTDCQCKDSKFLLVSRLSLETKNFLLYLTWFNTLLLIP